MEYERTGCSPLLRPPPLSRSEDSKYTAGRLFRIAHTPWPRAERGAAGVAESRDEQVQPRIRPVVPNRLDFLPRKCEKKARSTAKFAGIQEQARKRTGERLPAVFESAL